MAKEPCPTAKETYYVANETCCIAGMEAVVVEARQGERADERSSQRVVALHYAGLVSSIEV